MSARSRLALIRRQPAIIRDYLDHRINSKRYKTELEGFIAQLKSTSHEPSRSEVMKLNKLCCIEDWQNAELKKALDELREIGTPGGSHIHRKDWEWALAIVAMRRLGKLTKRSTALGIGSGKEALLFFLANNIKHVIATDLYEGGSWDEAPADFPDNPEKYCSIGYNRQALSAIRMDGTNLEFPPNNFDIVFSFSSIEHFGGTNHSGALEALKGAQRILRPGGIAVISTEFVINDIDHDEFFNRRTIFSDLLDKLVDLQLVEPLDLNISPKTLDVVLDYFKTGINWQKLSFEDKRRNPHILLRKKNALWTSVMLVLEKKGNPDRA